MTFMNRYAPLVLALILGCVGSIVLNNDWRTVAIQMLLTPDWAYIGGWATTIVKLVLYWLCMLVTILFMTWCLISTVVDTNKNNTNHDFSQARWCYALVAALGLCFVVTINLWRLPDEAPYSLLSVPSWRQVSLMASSVVLTGLLAWFPYLTTSSSEQDEEKKEKLLRRYPRGTVNARRRGEI